MAELSVIMLNYNQPDMERNSWISLRRCLQNIDHEMIAVVQKEGHPNMEWLRHNNIKAIVNSRNVGVPAGWNQGIREATAPYLLIANSDILAGDGFYPLMKHAVDQDDVAAVSPSNSFTRGHPSTLVSYPNHHSITQPEVDQTAHAIFKQYGHRVQNVSYAHGFFFMVTRHVLDKVGMFDESFGIGYFEEQDWCRRARKLGMRSVWVMGAFVHHYGGQTANKMAEEEGFCLNSQMKRSRKIFRTRYGRPR